MTDWYRNIEDDDIIICPYCSMAVKPSYKETYIGGVCVNCYKEGKVQSVTCDCCGKKFTIKPYQRGWNYKTETIDGEMTEEEWEQNYG